MIAFKVARQKETKSRSNAISDEHVRALL